MSITIEDYSNGNTHVECRWDKYNHFEVFVGIKRNGLVHTIKHLVYGNDKDKAMRSFKRQVALAKKGEIN